MRSSPGILDGFADFDFIGGVKLRHYDAAGYDELEAVLNGHAQRYQFIFGNKNQKPRCGVGSCGYKHIADIIFNFHLYLTLRLTGDETQSVDAFTGKLNQYTFGKRFGVGLYHCGDYLFDPCIDATDNGNFSHNRLSPGHQLFPKDVGSQHSYEKYDDDCHDDANTGDMKFLGNVHPHENQDSGKEWRQRVVKSGEEEI